MKSLFSTGRRTPIPIGDDEYSAIWNDEYFGAAEPTSQHESGGSAASVSVAATGAGQASEEAAGASVAGVLVQSSGSGLAIEVAQGGSTATVLIEAFGAGTAPSLPSRKFCAIVTIQSLSPIVAIDVQTPVATAQRLMSAIEIEECEHA